MSKECDRFTGFNKSVLFSWQNWQAWNWHQSDNWQNQWLRTFCQWQNDAWSELFISWYLTHLSRRTTKQTKWHVRPAKTQLNLGIHPVWSESSLCAQRLAEDLSFLYGDSEDSDQTGRMPKLIWVFAGRTCHSAGFVMRRLICALRPITVT